METVFSIKVSQDTIDFFSVMVGLFIILYYTYLFGLVMDKDPSVKKPTKKQFLYGLIPLVIWLIFFFEEYSELE